jgi:hypothetical protein
VGYNEAQQQWHAAVLFKECWTVGTRAVICMANVPCEKSELLFAIVKSSAEMTHAGLCHLRVAAECWWVASG